MKNGVDAACAVSVSRTKSPIAANTQNSAKPHTSAMHVRGTMPAEAAAEPEADEIADADHDQRAARPAAAGRRWRDHSTTAERAIGSARNRSISPDFESSAKKMLDAEAVEDRDLHEVAGDQVVDEASSPGCSIDPPNTYRNSRRNITVWTTLNTSELRRAHQVTDVAPRDHRRVAERGAARQRFETAGRAWSPTSVVMRHRNLGRGLGFGRRSSSVGRGGVSGEGEEHVVERRASAARCRPADPGVVESAHRFDEARAPSSTGNVDPVGAAIDGRPLRDRRRRAAPRRGRARRRRRRSTSSTSPASRRLSSVGVPVGDHRAVVDDHDVGRRVGRPPRGTAW